ncbi:toxin-antitoxin system YwqK family antitoxin [Hymenobacter monticola]|uniref:Uncharacterized protein n=1 Tax=Hymenobacter monticola TaxID=1705399 RepID=A0ABY4B8M0_9BACT|nr:hypothetical protein [Hymenobacter monticola]UOE35493.1 hypothetical protein MTP16_07535 [Hymenobacter monticola]
MGWPGLAASAQDLKLADCVKLMRADSAQLFFDARYALVPPACATIRRESRMDAATGSFQGEVRDYLVADNSLLTKVRYANGVREGDYEQHYANHQLATTGRFVKGQPTGTWKYWYASGQPWQTLELGSGGPMRIVAYWDSTGRQRVTDGAGTWEENTDGTMPTHVSGRVVAGLMEGTWERRSRLDKLVLTAEDYRAGRLLEGRQYMATVGKPKKYQDRSLLGPQAVDASAVIEPFHLGKSCEEQAALAASEAASRQLIASTVLVNPRPPRDPGTYQQQLLQRLHDFNNLTQWMPQTDGQSTLITADIDDKGQISHVVSESGTLASAFTTILADLGTWRPGSVNGRPVPGKLRITLRMFSTQLQSSLGANVAFPLPPDALRPASK